MAIDTAAKRLSILDFGNVFQPGMPIPNSTLDVDDRMQLLWAYAPEFVAYVITPGCATLTISQLHMTAILDSLVGSATLSDALAHISLASELTCNPALTVAVGTLEAWNDTGVLEPLYETATGQVADATFGCYALAAIGSRIYIGLANWPGSTNGGLIISTTNGKTFTIEKILDEQGVHELSVHGGVLWVPGTDPTDDWTMGK